MPGWSSSLKMQIFGGAFCLLPPCEDELSVASIRALSNRKSVVTKGTIVTMLPLKVVTFKHFKPALSWSTYFLVALALVLLLAWVAAVGSGGLRGTTGRLAWWPLLYTQLAACISSQLSLFQFCDHWHFPGPSKVFHWQPGLSPEDPTGLHFLPAYFLGSCAPIIFVSVRQGSSSCEHWQSSIFNWTDRL